MLKTVLFRFFTLAAIAIAGHAVAAQSAESWTSVHSENFSLIGNAPAADLQAAATRLEQFRWMFSRLYPRLKVYNQRKTNIVIFKDAASYFEFLPKRPDGTTDVGVAGYFQPGDDIDYITLAISPEQSDPLSTAVHEYFHSIAESNFDRSQLPPWANEGLAEYFETLRVDNGKNIVIGGQQIEHLRLLKRSTLIPIAEFFAITAADLRTMGQERRRVYYAQAWAVVHALMQNGGLSLDDLLSGIAKWSRTTGGASDEKAALYSGLEQDVEREIRGPFPQPKLASLTEPAPVSGRTFTDKVSLDRVAATLGDLLLHTGELPRSEVLLRQAIIASPEDPEANGSLGTLLVRQEKLAEAKPYLQKAVAGGNANPLVLFNCAYSTLHDHMNGNSIEQIPDDAAQTIRSMLRRAISNGPGFAESYRLLALVDFIRDEQLDDAVALLQKGLTIKKDDPEIQLLLAKILLRCEDVTRAGQIAEQVASTTSDIKRKAEANEIVKAVYDYNSARSTAVVPVRLNIILGGRQRLVVLKRSWLTDEDVAQIDRERENNNYNRLILRPISGETQIVGRIEKITCSGDSIIYRVRAKDTAIDLSSADFNGVRMTVAREGESTLQVGCGADISKELTVINYQPKVAPGTKTQGQITAISFVGDNFRLKTVYEMFAARLVTIDDDTLRRSGPRPAINAESIRRSIERSLRKPASDEERVLGIIQSVQCSASEVDFRVLSGDKTYLFARNISDQLELGWFTVASSQLPVSCGSGPLSSNAILTFTRNTGFANVNGELRSIEFVPDGIAP